MFVQIILTDNEMIYYLVPPPSQQRKVNRRANPTRPAAPDRRSMETTVLRAYVEWYETMNDVAGWKNVRV